MRALDVNYHSHFIAMFITPPMSKPKDKSLAYYSCSTIIAPDETIRYFGARDGSSLPSMNFASLSSNLAYGLASLKHEQAAMASKNSA